MRPSSTALPLLLSALCSFSTSLAIIKRADASEAASIGYATLNGGTTGGAGGKSTIVTTLAALHSCASQNGPAICVVSGTITGAATVEVSSDKTIIGKDFQAVLKGVGLTIKGVSNVIVRNLSIDKVLAENGDAIGINKATNIWIDHCDLQGDRTQDDKDKYDGLCDITHAADWITVSNTFLHNHWKASLIGHSDDNGDEDTGHLRVTFANNFFYDLNSRGPSVRFGTGHFFNNYYEKMGDAINTRLGAQVLVESNAFVNVDKPLYAVDGNGYAVSKDNNFGGQSDAAPSGKLDNVPYKYTLLGPDMAKSAVYGTTGATLIF